MFQDSEKISAHQALMLVLSSGLGNIYVIISSTAVDKAGRDGWIAVLIGYFLALLVGIAFLRLGTRFPTKTIVQYCPIVLGKFLGKIYGLVYILVMWSMAIVVLREMIELIRLILPLTPPIKVMAVLFMYLNIYALMKGFEVYARTTEIFVLIAITFIIVIIVFSIPNSNFKYLTPIFEEGVMPVLRAIPTQCSYGLETILFMALWLPCLNNKKEAKKAVLLGLSLSGILLTLSVIVTIALLGVEMTLSYVYPVFYMSSYIQIGRFFTGIEAIFMLAWIVSSYMQISVFFYPSVVGLAQWLNMKDYKILIVPMAIITIISVHYGPNNMVKTLKYDEFISTYIKLPTALFIIVIWIAAVIRKLNDSKI